MATSPLLVLRIGHMELYNGPGGISSGGGFVTANGVGGEIFNFKPSRGICYGFAMSRFFGGVNLNFLAPRTRWRKGDELAGVDVVFIARRPGYGQVVVGWYRNATVVHKEYFARRGVIRGLPEEIQRPYLCTANVADVQLLDVDDRVFEVPSAQAGNLGFPGQSNVWYPGNNLEHAEVGKFVSRLRTYIAGHSGVTPKDDEEEGQGGGGRKRKPNHAHNAEVELRAVQAVIARYEDAGYSVRSVESDNCGWDLVVEKGRELLHVEVKGASGASIYFELTPNEFRMLKEHAVRYRVCVVCNALTKPKIYELFPEFEPVESAWRLSSADKKVHVVLSPRIAAIGKEVGFDFI